MDFCFRRNDYFASFAELTVILSLLQLVLQGSDLPIRNRREKQIENLFYIFGRIDNYSQPFTACFAGFGFANTKRAGETN